MRRLLLACLMMAVFTAPAWSQADAGSKHTKDVIYGRKFGTALTMDVFQPAKPNGYGILFMVSGGWFSSHEAINGSFLTAFLDRGYTVFAVVHGSQPKFTIPEIIEDIHRAVRFARHNAVKYGVDPDHLGIAGGSAGGHLSLVMGTRGEPGKPDAKDPIDRESSAVQAVACFCPPTDFLNWREAGDNQVGIGPLGSQFKAAFGPRSDTPEGREDLGKEISPLYFVTSKTPPTLIIHGDADRVVPIFQAQIFEKKCQEFGATFKLVVREGKDHGWPEMTNDMRLLADWFDQHLKNGHKSKRRCLTILQVSRPRTHALRRSIYVAPGFARTSR
jgi:acetyl esterase/lipase